MKKLFFCHAVEVSCVTKTVASCFQASDCFLEGFFISFSDAHNFAYSAHLCAKLIFYTFEFFKCPACKFNYYVIPVRNVFIKSSVFSTWNVFQRKSGCKHCRYKGNREAGCFRCKGRGAGSTRVDFNDNDTVCYRVMGKLYVCTADYLYRFYDFICLLLKTFLAFLRDSKHWCGTEGVSCMYTERIDIFDKADSDHVVVCVTDNFQLKFFPAENRFFYKNLSYKACLKTSCTYCFQLFSVVYKTAACAAHCVCRTENNRVSQFVCDF